MKPSKPGARARRGVTQRLEDRNMLAADLGLEPSAVDGLLDQLEAVVVETPAIDGSNNNEVNVDWGAAGETLLRLSSVEYADALSDPAGDGLPSAREVSNAIADQTTTDTNASYLTDFVWMWGQFIDHDIDLTETADPGESFDIVVPTGDAEFDPLATGEAVIGLSRSEYEVDEEGVRQQVNSVTAYIDGSVVYGSDAETAASLREFEGGRLLTSEGDLLPIGEDGFFMAGDVRANENVALTAIQTLWVREHNRLADEISAADPSLDDEEVFQRARALVVAEIQAITFNQWLPALLGVEAVADYEGYDPTVNASIANVFSTAAYRFGHTMLSTELLRLDNDGTVAAEGNLSLADAFFSPDELLENGIDSLLAGAAVQLAQEIDNQVVDDVRNFLFGSPGAGGFDLASLNVQRGRDHGLADYNQIREDYGLPRVTEFSDITSDADLADRLEQLYGSVDQIDAWVGILAEDHAGGSVLGELGTVILVDQFTRLRDGDRFWYENRFTGEVLAELNSTTLSDVVERNTELTGLRENVFYDQSVLFYTADASEGTSRGANEMMLIAQQEELWLVDTRSGKILASRPQDEVTKVVVVGSDSDDRVLVHPSALRLGLSGGIVVDGQSGGRDAVVLMGGAGFDTVAIDGAFSQFGETLVQVEGVERLVIEPGPGADELLILGQGEYDLVVNDDQPDPPKRQQRPDETPPPRDVKGVAEPTFDSVKLAKRGPRDGGRR